MSNLASANHTTVLSNSMKKDVSYIAAFPKSGITYLNFMLFHVLFDRPQDVRLIDSDYIFDVHESLAQGPAARRHASLCQNSLSL